MRKKRTLGHCTRWSSLNLKVWDIWNPRLSIIAGFTHGSVLLWKIIYQRVFSGFRENFCFRYYPCDNNRHRTVFLIIRWLDNHMNGIPYRCHRAMKTPDVPPAFTVVINDYLEYCTEIGNKPGTINEKKRFCLIFLQFLLDIECNDISEITAGIVAKSRLIYTNKDGYVALRQFLRYLFEKGYLCHKVLVRLCAHAHSKLGEEDGGGLRPLY